MMSIGALRSTSRPSCAGCVGSTGSRGSEIKGKETLQWFETWALPCLWTQSVLCNILNVVIEGSIKATSPYDSLQMLPLSGVRAWFSAVTRWICGDVASHLFEQYEATNLQDLKAPHAWQTLTNTRNVLSKHKWMAHVQLSLSWQTLRLSSHWGCLKYNTDRSEHKLMKKTISCSFTAVGVFHLATCVSSVGFIFSRPGGNIGPAPSSILAPDIQI